MVLLFLQFSPRWNASCAFVRIPCPCIFPVESLKVFLLLKWSARTVLRATKSKNVSSFSLSTCSFSFFTMYLQISRFFLFCFFPFYGRSSLLESFFKKRFVRQSLARRKNESKIDKRAKGVRKNNSRAEQIADRELSSFASSFFFPFFLFYKEIFPKRGEGGGGGAFVVGFEPSFSSFSTSRNNEILVKRAILCAFLRDISRLSRTFSVCAIYSPWKNIYHLPWRNFDSLFWPKTMTNTDNHNLVDVLRCFRKKRSDLKVA